MITTPEELQKRDQADREADPKAAERNAQAVKSAAHPSFQRNSDEPNDKSKASSTKLQSPIADGRK